MSGEPGARALAAAGGAAARKSTGLGRSTGKHSASTGKGMWGRVRDEKSRLLESHGVVLKKQQDAHNSNLFSVVHAHRAELAAAAEAHQQTIVKHETAHKVRRRAAVRGAHAQQRGRSSAGVASEQRDGRRPTAGGRGEGGGGSGLLPTSAALRGSAAHAAERGGTRAGQACVRAGMEARSATPGPRSRGRPTRMRSRCCRAQAATQKKTALENAARMVARIEVTAQEQTQARISAIEHAHREA